MLLSQKHIFVVEDNMKNRVVLQVCLGAHGAKVSFERKGDNTVRLLQTISQVDLILLDLMLLNGVNGFDVYDKIRELPEFSHVPIVAVSASDPSTAIPLARKKGFAGFIAKPIDTDVFPRQLLKVLNNEEVWDSGTGV